MKLKEDENTTLESYFKEFYDWFYDYLVSDGIDEDTIETLAEKQLDGPWDVRTYFHEPHLLALNVKGKGAGDWQKYDLNGRASKFDADEGQYYDMLQGNIESFFEGWAETFKEDYGVDLYAGGRSGGWWGFKIDDIDKDGEIFQMNKEKVRQLFDTKAPTLLLSEGEEDEDFDMQDFAYDLASEVDASEYISFTPSFVRDCKYFYNEIVQTSNEWESQDWNDEQFENDKEWNSWEESKKDNSKRMTENDKYRGKITKKIREGIEYKKEINALCEWAVQDYGDRDALFFGAGYDGYLIKGRMLDFYVDEIIDNSSSPDEEELEDMENDDYEVDNNDKEGLQKSGDIKSEAFANLVNDYQDATGAHFDYKIINPHDGEFCVIEIEEK